MFPFGGPVLGDDGPAVRTPTRVLTQTGSANGTYPFTGCTSGDFAIIMFSQESGAVTPASGGGTWTPVAPVAAYTKVLNGSDLASGVTINNGGSNGWFIVVYRGIASIGNKFSILESGSNSYTPAPMNNGTLLLSQLRNDNGVSVTTPTGFTQVALATYPGISGTATVGNLMERLSPPNPTYAGQTITLSAGSGSITTVYEMISQTF